MSALPEDYLEYPVRRYGMDHDRYGWSDMFERPPVVWPNGAKIAVSLVTHVQHFPLNMPDKPFKAPGALSMPYPDFRYYTNRDYGNRIAVFRLLRLFEEMGIQGDFAVNGVVAERYPAVVEAIRAASHGLVAHGWDMGCVHHSGLSETEEAGLIARTLGALRSTGPVTGWLSPGRAQSFVTPDLLAEAGIEWCLDWANDDLPYEQSTRSGPLLAMPCAYETDDRVVSQEFFHSEVEWVQQIRDRFDVLYREAQSHGGRVMSLPLHTWVSGMPYRIEYLREALDYIRGHAGVWLAPSAEIAAAFRAQAKTASR